MAYDPNARDESLKETFDELEGDHARTRYYLMRVEKLETMLPPIGPNEPVRQEIIDLKQQLEGDARRFQGELLRLRQPED